VGSKGMLSINGDEATDKSRYHVQVPLRTLSSTNRPPHWRGLAPPILAMRPPAAARHPPSADFITGGLAETECGEESIREKDACSETGPMRPGGTGAEVPATPCQRCRRCCVSCLAKFTKLFLVVPNLLFLVSCSHFVLNLLLLS